MGIVSVYVHVQRAVVKTLIMLLVVALGSAVASAGPTGRLVVTHPGDSAEALLIVLDHTSSMEETVDGEVKITVAKDIILDLVRVLGAGTKVGLREFAGCGLTSLLVPIQPLDFVSFAAAVAAITTYGATPIAYTLEQIPGDFGNISGKKLVLLITDGMDTCRELPEDLDPVEVAEKLLSDWYDLRINVVGFDVGRISKARDQLMRIARATGGAYFEASNREELRQALGLSSLLGYSVYDLGYSVYDADGSLAVTGWLAKAAVLELPVGAYRVVFGSEPAVTLEVVVSDQQTTVIEVEFQDGTLHASVGG